VPARILVVGDDRSLLGQAEPLLRRPGDARVDLCHHDVALRQDGLHVARKSVSAATDEKRIDPCAAPRQGCQQARVGALITIGQVGRILEVGVAMHQAIQNQLAHLAAVLLLFIDVDAEIVRLTSALGNQVTASLQEEERPAI